MGDLKFLLESLFQLGLWPLIIWGTAVAVFYIRWLQEGKDS